MTPIEPIREKHSLSIRLWHWINALILTGSLLTVLLNSTLLDKHQNSSYIQEKLRESGTSVTNSQAKVLANDFEDRVWDIHIYIGYFLTALLLFRLLAELFQKKDQRLFAKIKNAYRTYRLHLLKTAKHQLTVKIIYAVFYLILCIITLTGLSVAFDDDLGISRTLSHQLKDIHGFCMYLLLAFIAVHVLGVLLAEKKDSPGIVSDMINGGR